MHTRQHINSEAIVTTLLWCGALLCGYYFFDRIITQEKFGFHDWYLFIGHAKTFISTGTLYERDLSLYEPSAAIYKFPPLYASLLVFFLHCGFSEETIKQITWLTYFSCYFLSIVICLQLPQQKNPSRLLPAALIIAFTFEPFFDNYDSSQMEVYILLLLSLGLLCLTKSHDLVSGIFIGIASAIKIYPIYFCGYYFSQRKYTALAGVFIGIALSLAFSFALVGAMEHQFYFYNILPTLLTEHVSGKGENISLAHLLLVINIPMRIAESIASVVLLMPLVIVFIQSGFKRRMKSSSTESATLYNIWFSIFIATLLLATKNSWWNYQILLMIPLLVLLELSLRNKETDYLPLIILIAACLMIFWCNLGKLDALIVIFSKVLDTSPFLTSIMLKINLLRGLGTFLILCALVFSLQRQQSKNISLVESGLNT